MLGAGLDWASVAISAGHSDSSRGLMLKVSGGDQSMGGGSHAAQDSMADDACDVSVQYNSHQGYHGFSLNLFLAAVA